MAALRDDQYEARLLRHATEAVGVRKPRRASSETQPMALIQLPFRHRRFELRDFSGLRRLAVESQHVAFRRDGDPVTVDNVAGEDHLRQRILYIALDDPLQRTRTVGGIPALGRQPVA